MQGTADFSNTLVPSKSLPQLEQLNFEPLAHVYGVSNRCISIFLTLFIIAVLLIVQLQSFNTLSSDTSDVVSNLMMGVALIGFISTIYIGLSDKRKLYSLREQDLSYQSGLIFRKTVSQPMLRIQHVELKRGPIDRKIGLAKLQVFSAGGAMHTFEIPGLPIEKAESIRQFILDHRDVNHHG
jgi:membrane protein YdbS with pleckstrin-like domain